MKCLRAVAAGALVMLTAACGARATTAAAAPDLRSELLSVSDLPAGWSVAPNRDSSSWAPLCLQNAKTGLKPTSKAEATFEGGSRGVPLLSEEMVYLPGQGQAEMRAISKVMSGCGQISVPSDGQTLTGTVGAMSFPSVADQSSVWQMNLSGTVSGVPITFGIDLVSFRKADTVAVILYGGLGTPDILVVETLVMDAAAKLT